MDANNFVCNVVEIMGIISTVFLALLLYSIFRAAKLFNRLIKLKEFCDEGWSGVLAALERKRNIIANIAKAAEAYIPPESEAIRNMTQACEQGQAALCVTETIRAEACMKAALVGFMAAIENYPELKNDKNIKQFMEELSRLEERIEKTRRYYNATVRDYNMEMKQFPANLAVRLMGFRRAVLFEAGTRKDNAQCSMKN